MVIVFHRRKLIETADMEQLLESLDELCRKITNFRKTLGE